MPTQSSLWHFPARLAIAAAGVAATSGCHTNNAASCDAPDAAAYVPTYHPIDSDGRTLRDAHGRALVLRGFNIKVDGIFDVTPDNGQPVREPIPPLDNDDFALMQRGGVNVLRLPLNWSAIEPSQGNYQDAYLDAVAAFLDRIQSYGFYVLLDIHQDGWSKDLCEDGAPAWATVVTDLSDGGLSSDCHVSNAALSAHANFFENDANSLQEAFAAMCQKVATRFASDDRILGYEIFNEPIAGDSIVDAFSIEIANAIRRVDTRHLIVWEPDSFRNFTNRSLVSPTPFPVDGCVYAVHIYATIVPLLTRSIAAAEEEANAWHEPLMVTEHGGTPVNDGGFDWLDALLDGFDDGGISSMDWIWNPGVVTRDDAGAIQMLLDGSVYDHLTRPYPMAIGGDLDSTTWDGTALTVTFHGHAGVAPVHDIYWNGTGPTVTCDGQALTGVQAMQSGVVFRVSCGTEAASCEHKLVFAPGP